METEKTERSKQPGMIQGVLATSAFFKTGVVLARLGLKMVLPEVAKLVDEPDIAKLADTIEPEFIAKKTAAAFEQAGLRFGRQEPVKEEKPAKEVKAPGNTSRSIH